MITDGTYVCAHCGEWRTGCQLCGVATLIDCREEISRKSREELYAEIELNNQSRAIRQGAEARREYDRDNT